MCNGVQAVAFPLETVARRLQVNGGSNFAVLTARIVQEGGPAALYRCSTATINKRRCGILCPRPVQGTLQAGGSHVWSTECYCECWCAWLQGHRRSQPEGGAHGVRQLWDV